MGKINKMNREELIAIIDKVEGYHTVYTGSSKQELINKFIGLVNKGLI